ncbi:carboxypeptidase regulatory-like domain-containing protein [bacterium]|nr:carboxypeptidase regulatory-like domain-containing protein [bacterium]
MRQLKFLGPMALVALVGCGLWGSYDPIRYTSPAPPSAEIRWIKSSVSDLAADVEVRDVRANTKPDVVEKVTVVLSSGTDKAGKSLTLVETGPNTGVFRGTVALMRPFDPQTGAALPIGGERLAIFAEGAPAGDPLEAAYSGPAGLVKANAVYMEPNSTVIGHLVWPDGRACPGADVVLEGDNSFRMATRSRADGNYAFYGVPMGTYQMTATKDGATVQRIKIVNAPRDGG